MNENASRASSPPVAGPLDDPFKYWPNSDLLIDEEDRAFFARHFPAFATIFDWPELRALFEIYEAAAEGARKHSRRAGVVAIAAGFLSLAVAAVVPLVDEFSRSNPSKQLHAQAVLGGIAAAFAIVSMLIGYTQVLTGEGKARWLTNRFWSERIRQFHFQLIVNNLPTLVAAIQNKSDFRAWVEFRARELDRFKHDYLRGVEDKIHHLDVDEAEDRPWLCSEWERAGPVPAASPEFDELLKLLEQQRFGVQQRYAERKLINGWHSPESRAQWVLKLSDTLTAVLLLATIIVGVGSIMAFTEGTNPAFRLAAGLVAAISSCSIVAMRALKEGLLFSADAERYRWYLAAVRNLYRRYEHADRPQKVSLFRELEHVAYQEMRRFILSGAQARFVM
jgi:hypothetical protein